MTKKIKHLMMVSKMSPAIQECLDEFPRRSGFFNWHFVFDGDFKPYYEVNDLEAYDVVHMNLPPNDWSTILEVRDKLKNSDTKLVLNNDHVAEMWDKWNMDPWMYQKVQQCGDLVFGTEPYQTTQMIDRAVTIPHPTDTSFLRMMKWKKPQHSAGFLYHWWNGTVSSNCILSRKIKEEHGLGTRLFAYTGTGGSQEMNTWNRLYYDTITQPMPFPQYIIQLMDNKFIVENCNYHTYGRTTVETAALSIPVVGSDRVFSMRHCYPELVSDPYDMDTIRDNIKKILNGGEWLQDQMDYAKEHAEYFNYKNSKSRFLEALDGISK